MNLKSPLSFTLLTIGLIIVVWFFFLQTPEKDRILEKLENLEELISQPTPSGLLEKAAVLQSFRKLFADPVVIETRIREANGIRSPDELAGAYIGLVSQGYKIDISFEQPKVSIPAEREAHVETRVEGFLTRSTNQTSQETRPITIVLGKDESGEWRFERFSEK